MEQLFTLLVATANPVSFGFGRMTQMLGMHKDFHFSSVLQAC